MPATPMMLVVDMLDDGSLLLASSLSHHPFVLLYQVRIRSFQQSILNLDILFVVIKFKLKLL